MKLLFSLLGLVLIVEGLPYFAFPGKMKKWIATVQDMPDPHLRVFGFAVMVLGLLIVYLMNR
ncbi:MAG: DUF2065 domain-containing protein [Desulfobacterales bacterium]|nr:DUF2065 domain-containing protein [Desulfobacterales bacterium]